MDSEPFWNLSTDKDKAFITWETLYAFSHNESRLAIKDFLVRSIKDDTICEQYNNDHPTINWMVAEDIMGIIPLIGLMIAVQMKQSDIHQKYKATRHIMEQLDIRQLIGEATEYDKKQALEVKKPKSWCKSVSAFANGIGGKLVWGVEGVYVSNEDEIVDSQEQGGQKGGQKEEEKTIDTILQLIKHNPGITRRVLAQTVSISPSAIQKHINRLKADGTIVRHGGDRGGYWEVLK